MAEPTFGNTSQFGLIMKLRIVTRGVNYGLGPEADDDTEQRLTILKDGRVWLSRYGSRDGRKGVLRKKEVFRVTDEAVQTMMDAVTEIFSGKISIEKPDDAGSWNAELTDAGGKIVRFGGPLCRDFETENGELSHIIRNQLGRDDLYVFDGNPDSLSRIEIHYDHTRKVIQDVRFAGDGGQPALTRSYTEQLLIDSSTGTVEHLRDYGGGCRVSGIWHIQEGISYLLATLEDKALWTVRGKPPETAANPPETGNCEIILQSERGRKQTFHGDFDPGTLPDAFYLLHDFMVFYGIGEMSDQKSIFGKTKHIQKPPVSCNIVFEEGV